MGLLNSALHVGRNALLGYQGAIQVVGNNISSAGSSDYTRLSPDLSPVQGSLQLNGLQPGAGVVLSDIQRNVDTAIESRVRLAIGDAQAAQARQATATQMEGLFTDLTGTGAVEKLTTFLHTFDDLQNTPEDTSSRDLVISSGASLAQSLQDLRAQLGALGEDTDSQIAPLVERADVIAQDIAAINSRITTSEALSAGEATGLRDQRDAMLRELSELFDVSTRLQPDGTVNVYVGSETLVQGSVSRGLIAETESDGEFVRTAVRFADTGAEMDIRGGRLDGLIESRDEIAYGRIESIDELAAAVIEEVNRIHADGQGTVGYTEVTGTNPVLDADATLDSSAAGLGFPPTNGSFLMTVTDDASGTPTTHRIEIDLDGIGTDTTLNSLAADINATDSGVTATVTADNRLSLIADDGVSFTFGHDGQIAQSDTSGTLSALGINTFFTGTGAQDIEVNETLIGQPGLLAAATTFHTGDGTNATQIAALDTAGVERLGGGSLNDFYNTILNSAASIASTANEDVESTDAVLLSLTAQRESISGVNLDEEAIALLKYERSFQGASRYVSVVNDLLEQLVALIR